MFQLSFTVKSCTQLKEKKQRVDIDLKIKLIVKKSKPGIPAFKLRIFDNLPILKEISKCLNKSTELMRTLTHQN